MSACPAWRAVSSIRCRSTHRGDQTRPAGIHGTPGAVTGNGAPRSGRPCTIFSTAADGLMEAEIRGHSEEMVSRQLAGLAQRIDVLWPESVRHQLVEIGRALVRHHGAASARRDGRLQPGAGRQ